jgi:hypothetical protein
VTLILMTNVDAFKAANITPDLMGIVFRKE